MTGQVRSLTEDVEDKEKQIEDLKRRITMLEQDLEQSEDKCDEQSKYVRLTLSINSSQIELFLVFMCFLISTGNYRR